MYPNLDTRTAHSTSPYGDLSGKSYDPYKLFGSKPFPWSRTSGVGSGSVGGGGGGGGGSWGGDTVVQSPSTPSVASSAPTPTAEPTIGSALGTGGFDRNAALQTLNQAEAQLQEIQRQKDALYGSQADTAGQGNLSIAGYDNGPSYNELYGPEIDEEAERRRIMKLFQGQIDATNMVYDQLLNEARMEGEGRLGSQRAIGARSGILGSDFAGAQKKKVQDFNTDIYRSIGAERSAAIAAILGEGRRYAAQEIAAKRAARQQGAENYISFLANQDARRNNWAASVAQSIIDQGGTYEDAKEIIEQEAQDAGIDPLVIRDMYNRLMKGGSGENKKYTLSAGETLVDEQGNVVAQGSAAAQRILKEGDVIVDADGNVIQSIPKTTAAGGAGGNKVYSSKNLPGDVRSDLIDDLQSSQPAQDGTLTVEELMRWYPEVDTATLQEFYDNYYSAPESPGFFEEGGWWDNFWD